MSQSSPPNRWIKCISTHGNVRGVAIQATELVREQAKLLRHDPDGAIAGIPELLARVDPDAVRAGGQKLAALFDRDEGLTQEEAARLGAMLDLFNAAADADRG